MRKITTIFVLAVMMLVLAACGLIGSDDPEPTEVAPVEEPTEEPVEEPTEEPMEEPAEEPMEEATEEPVEEAVEEPSEEAPAEEAAAAAGPPPYIGMQTERLRALDFSPFETELADFSAERAAAVEAIVIDATILDVQAALDAGDLTSEELTLFFLSRIQQYDEGLRTYTEINANALDEARGADELRAQGTVLGPLHGIPINLKDNIGTTAPLHTTGGAEILLDNVPAEDAPLVTQLREAGAVILGKANLSELAGGVALFPAGYTAVAGQTINPHGAEFPTLGSSSGSAASTAATLTMASVGSETGGSLIAPSSLNGVVGMYPTDDLVMDDGVIPLVSSTDTPGPIGRSVTDAAVILAAIDTADVDYTETLDANALNGVTAGFLTADLSPENPTLGLSGFEDTSDQGEKLQMIADILAAAGTETVPAEMVRVEAMAPSDELIMATFGPTLEEMGITDLSDLDDAMRAEIEQALPLINQIVLQFFSPLVSGGVAYDMMGYLVDAGAPVENLADFQAYNNEMPERRIPNGQYQIDQAVPQIEAGLTREVYEQVAEAAQPALAATLDATFEETGAEILVSMGNEHSSYYALAGYPAITVPLGLRASGGPTGVTLIGKPGTDAQLLAYAYAFEQASMLRQNPDLEATMQPAESADAGGAEAQIDSMAGLGDPLYPGLGNQGYDVQHYTIEMTVDVPSSSIEATTSIEAEASQELTSFNLDFSGLEISEVLVDGEAADFSREGSELVITPAAPIAEGAAFTTAVTYSGVPEPIVDPGVPFTPIGWLAFPDEDVISVISQPSGAMSWFPNNNHQQDKASYTIRVTVEKPYTVAANGELAETIDNGDTNTYVWQMDDPMASYLATVNIGEFERDDTIGPDGLLLRNYYPAGRVDEFAPAFEPTAEMIEFFSGILGPYPYGVYGAVVLPLEGEFALETQTMSVFVEGAVNEETIAHEIMHHWLGNDLSPETWQDVWLNEGFSQYFQLLWDEHVNGPENINRAMNAYYEYVADEQLAPPATVPVEGLFSEPIYVRGAMTMHALRTEVSDEVFFDILRTYYERFAGGTASTQDFIDVAVEVGGDELADFLNSWLYEEEVPAWPGS